MNSEIHPAPAEFSAQELADDPILRYFHYRHLPPALQRISQPACELAREMIEVLPRNAERTAGLRKLLEAKDCFVRSNVPDPAQGNLGLRPAGDAGTLDLSEADELREEGRTTARHIRGEDDGPIPFDDDSRPQVDRRDPIR